MDKYASLAPTSWKYKDTSLTLCKKLFEPWHRSFFGSSKFIVRQEKHEIKYSFFTCTKAWQLVSISLSCLPQIWVVEPILWADKLGNLKLGFIHQLWCKQLRMIFTLSKSSKWGALKNVLFCPLFWGICRGIGAHFSCFKNRIKLSAFFYVV